MADARAFFDLYVKTPISQFGADKLPAFELILRRQAMASNLRPLTSPLELQLDPAGKTLRGGARLSAVAFNRCAVIIASGLSAFLPELAGIIKTTRNDNDRVDGRLARQIWNGLVDIRFSLISRYRLLCDMERNTIDGLAKSGYSPLLNDDAYTAGRDALAASKPSFKFYAGSLSHRAMAAWFREATPFIEVASRAFYRGYYLASGELSGVAPRLTPAVLFSQGTCLAPFGKYGKKIKTIMGIDERIRAAQGFGEVASRPFPDDVLLQGLKQLDDTLLGFAPTPDERLQQDVLKRLRKALTDRDVARGQAMEIARIALSLGRNMTTPADARLRAITTTYSNRTLLDLLVPLCKAARRTSMRRREILEQAAFSIITGQLLSGRPAHGPSISIKEGQSQSGE
jgi:hypothetical protein